MTTNAKPLMLAAAALKQGRAEHQYNTYALGVGPAPQLPDGVTFHDLFRPAFWSQCVKTLKPGDLIRVRDVRAGWDFVVSVVDVDTGGCSVRPWPIYPKGYDQ